MNIYNMNNYNKSEAEDTITLGMKRDEELLSHSILDLSNIM